MKQTAVEWLYEHILLTPLDIRSINKCLEKAKEMEKNQNKYFYDHGFYTGRCTDNNKNESFEYFFNSYKSE
jgi:hypothetical protein